MKVDPLFIPSGGTINDASIRAEFHVGHDWGALTLVQYEQWKFPLFAPGLQKNIITSVQFAYWPQSRSH